MAVNLKSSPAKQMFNNLMDKYERQGYHLTVEPDEDHLPEFLRGYRPDLIAEKPGEAVAVEVKDRDKVRRANYWHDLAAVINQQPGWRFDFVVVNQEQNSDKQSITVEEILSLIDEGQVMEQREKRETALLITWPAVETALRLAAETYRVELPDISSRTLISRLYADGILEDEEYQALKEGSRLRNAVAHGYREGAIGPYLLPKLREIVNRLVGVNGAST